MSAGNQTDDKLHITTTGREGRALRKKLAIALGLRVSSSAGSSASTTSHSEEEEETAHNVMEIFRKQLKMTATQRKQLPKLHSDQQQVSSEASSLMFRRTLHRKTTTRREFQGDDVDINDTDHQERSRDHIVKKQESYNVFTNKHNKHTTSQEKTAQNYKTNKRLSLQDSGITLTDTPRQVNSHAHFVQSRHDNSAEEVFSCFGDQTEALSENPTSTSAESARLLREKIRKNTRARKLPKAGYLLPDYREKEKIEKSYLTRKDFEGKTELSSARKQGQRRLSGSQIPLYVTKTDEQKSVYQGFKSTEVDISAFGYEKNRIENENMGNKSIQKTRIPRRKNAIDRKDASKTKDLEIESLISEVFSNNTDFISHDNEMKIDILESGTDDTEEDTVCMVKSSQELQSSANSNTLFDEVPTFEKSAEKKRSNETMTKHNIRKKLANILTIDKATNQNISTKIHHSKPRDTGAHSNDTRDFDSLVSELARLKASVFRTYDDFREMKDLTLSLSKELKKIRHI